MRSSGKQPIKSDEVSPSQLILPMDANQHDGDQERDEDSYNGTRDYQSGTPAFLELALDEKEDADDTAPDDAIEVLDVKLPDAPDVKHVKESRKARPKTQRPSKEK